MKYQTLATYDFKMYLFYLHPLYLVDPRDLTFEEGDRRYKGRVCQNQTQSAWGPYSPL